jgi:hypothetical protein
MKIVDTIINDEKRFIIINEETGEIIDDAQGYGFKTYEKAIKFYNYKQKFPIIKNNKLLKNTVNNFYKKYPELIKIKDEIEDWLFCSLKNGENINNKHTNNKILKEIRERIEELYDILEKDEQLKYYFLKNF